jgi:hypothetical protein
VKCPDCGGELKQTELVAIDKSLRCITCGGVWTEGWVINEIAAGKAVDVGYKKPGKEINEAEIPVCPTDGGRMSREEGDNFPGRVKLWRCHKCNWWWLPQNNIFDLKQAYEVKTEYQRLWNKGKKVSSLVLPVVLTVVLLLGLGGVVAAVRHSQQITTEAASAVSGRIMVMYLGDSRVQIRFMATREVDSVMYKRDTDELWEEALVLSEGDWKVIVISGVNPGERLWLSVAGQVWKLTAGQKQ